MTLDNPTVLLAGRIAAPAADDITSNLTEKWNVKIWNESDGGDKFHELLRDCDAVVTARIVDSLVEHSRLKLLQVPVTGYEQINPEFVPIGCSVCNTFEHEITIAEYILWGMLEWETKLGDTSRHFKAKGWDGHTLGSSAHMHSEMYRKTVGIVGYGHIGRETAVRAKAFGMKVCAVSRSERPTEPPLDWYGTMDQLDRLLAESDHVIVTLPAEPETVGMFDAAMLAKMKPTGVITNVGRGPVIDPKALYNALSEQRIGGAIIDVWYDYPPAKNPYGWPSKDNPFQELDNIIMTPHISAMTEPMRMRRQQFIAANLDRLARGEPVENVCFVGG